MLYKYLWLLLALVGYSVEAQAQSCDPPKKIQSICGQCQGGGGQGENSPKFNIRQAEFEDSFGSLDKNPDISGSLKKQLEKCWEGISNLDKECESDPSSSSCEKRSNCIDDYEKILGSITQRDNKFPESDSRHRAILEELEKETDPQNLKNCADAESEKKQSLKSPSATIAGLEAPNKEFTDKNGNESLNPAPATDEFGPRIMAGLTSGEGSKKGKIEDKKRDKNTPEGAPGLDDLNTEQGKLEAAAFWKFFTNRAVAEGSVKKAKAGFFDRLKESFSTLVNGGAKSREEGSKSFDQGEYTAQQRVQTILARNADQATKENYKHFVEERNHQVRLTNDISGRGQAAVEARFNKNVDEQKKINDELDKAIKAIAKFCQNQRASVKCWKTGNTPPPLPFPFGGGPPPEEETPETEIEDWSELIKRSASYYCPNPDQPFILTGGAGLWRSGVILTPKGIVLTHLDPLSDFEFHPKGCLVRIPDPLDPENFEVYVSEPRFIQDVSIRDQLIYLVPEAPHVENNVFLGTPEDKRKFPTILDYIKSSPDSCTTASLRMGTPLKIIAYNEPAKYEKKRPIGVFDALSTAFPSGNQKTMTAIAEAQDGLTGGIVAHRDTKCFQGIGQIKKINEETTVRDIIPLETIDVFIAESIEVLNSEEN